MDFKLSAFSFQTITGNSPVLSNNIKRRTIPSLESLLENLEAGKTFLTVPIR